MAVIFIQSPLEIECSQCGAAVGTPCKGGARYKPLLTDPHPERRYYCFPYVEEDRGFRTKCWITTLSIQNQGYGRIRRDGREWLTHRWSWTQLRGPIPEGLTLDHLCSQTRCCNPDHLEPVTQAENVHRGRGTKITEEQARSIYRLRHQGLSLSECGDQLGLTRDQVWSVVRGRSWRELYGS